MTPRAEFFTWYDKHYSQEYGELDPGTVISEYSFLLYEKTGGVNAFVLVTRLENKMPRLFALHLSNDDLKRGLAAFTICIDTLVSGDEEYDTPLYFHIFNESQMKLPASLLGDSLLKLPPVHIHVAYFELPLIRELAVSENDILRPRLNGLEQILGASSLEVMYRDAEGAEYISVTDGSAPVSVNLFYTAERSTEEQCFILHANITVPAESADEDRIRETEEWSDGPGLLSAYYDEERGAIVYNAALAECGGIYDGNIYEAWLSEIIMEFDQSPLEIRMLIPDAKPEAALEDTPSEEAAAAADHLEEEDAEVPVEIKKLALVKLWLEEEGYAPEYYAAEGAGPLLIMDAGGHEVIVDIVEIASAAAFVRAVKVERITQDRPGSARRLIRKWSEAGHMCDLRLNDEEESLELSAYLPFDEDREGSVLAFFMSRMEEECHELAGQARAIL